MSNTPMTDPDCGTKHLKLAVWVVAIVIFIVGTLFGVSTSTTSDHDERLRAMETNDAAKTEQWRSVKEFMMRIDKRLEKLEERK